MQILFVKIHKIKLDTKELQFTKVIFKSTQNVNTNILNGTLLGKSAVLLSLFELFNNINKVFCNKIYNDKRWQLKNIHVVKQSL